MARHAEFLPAADCQVPVFADGGGYLAAMDTFRVGNAIIELGGGRRKLGDALDLSVGLSDVASVGDYVDSERPLAVVHAASRESAEAAARMIRAACATTEEAPPERPVVYRVMIENDAQ